MLGNLAIHLSKRRLARTRSEVENCAWGLVEDQSRFNSTRFDSYSWRPVRLKGRKAARTETEIVHKCAVGLTKMWTSRLDCCVYNSTRLTRGQAKKRNPDLSMKSKSISRRCLILRACTTRPLENARGSRKGVYLFYNPRNNFSRPTLVDRSCIFCGFFRVSRYGIVKQPFIYASLASAKRSFSGFPWPI